MLTNLLSTFFLSIGLGMPAYLLGIPKSQTGNGFFKLIGFICFASLIFFFALAPKSIETPALLIILTSFLLGNIVFCMLLGHWYLVVPKMNEMILYKSFRFFFLALFMRFILSCWPIVTNSLSWQQFYAQASSWDWMIFLMRYLWGYVMLALLGYFTRKLILMRSLQSATGVLYVMVFFVFIGEMIGLYMYQHFQGPS